MARSPLNSKGKTAANAKSKSKAKAKAAPEAPLRQVTVSGWPEHEDVLSVILEREFAQQPGVYTDVATGLSSVSVFLPLADADKAPTRARLRAALWELASAGHVVEPGTITVRTVPPQDWSESWKRHFKPLEIGPSLLVKPTWSRRAPKRGQQVVLLDPGLSFGTGQHATTHFCLTQVAALRSGAAAPTLMDMGTGSGILAIAAAKLGYARVEAFDFDPDCVRITAENAALNGVSDAVKPELADVTKLPLRSREQYDVVCANLISDLLIAHRRRILARVRPGGAVVLAGILATQFKDVATAYAGEGWEVVKAKTEREWRSAMLRRTKN